MEGLKRLNREAMSTRKTRSAPTCPFCSTKMVHRVRRSDGNPFWGCPNYPDCEGTRNARPGDFSEGRDMTENDTPNDNARPRPRVSEGEQVPALDAPGLASKMLDAFKEGAGEVGSIMLEKGKRKSAALVAGEIVQIARSAAGEHWPAWLEGPKAQRAAMFLVPFNMGMLIKAFAPEHKMAALAIEACSYAYKGVAEDVAEDVADHVVPLLADVAKLGVGLGVGIVSNKLSSGEEPPKLKASTDDGPEY
jgi:ssDNA-binding Zn-finger/Zn-ribbon topoisomerase 1